MKAFISALSCLAAISSVAAHATFQDLWVNGVDQQATCDRLPLNNNPVQSVTIPDIACNTGTSPAGSICTVNSGGTVTVEMHQQPGDRNCANEAISDTHHGPVLVYMAKVSDASTAVGSSAAWFKIYHSGYGVTAPTGSWATDVLVANCGKLTVTIPSDIPAGDYLLRAEVIALHVAQSTGGAQFYMSCYQLHVTGGGSASPGTVSFPGAYKATDPGILIDIYSPISTYIIPGPTVYAGGGGPASTPSSTTSKSSSTTGRTGTTTTGRTTTTTTAHTTTTTSGGGGSCSNPAAKYGQCGGIGWTGATCCAAGSTCQVSNPYYSQCL